LRVTHVLRVIALEQVRHLRLRSSWFIGFGGPLVCCAGFPDTLSVPRRVIDGGALGNGGVGWALAVVLAPLPFPPGQARPTENGIDPVRITTEPEHKMAAHRQVRFALRRISTLPIPSPQPRECVPVRCSPRTLQQFLVTDADRRCALLGSLPLLRREQL